MNVSFYVLFFGNKGQAFKLLNDKFFNPLSTVFFHLQIFEKKDSTIFSIYLYALLYLWSRPQKTSAQNRKKDPLSAKCSCVSPLPTVFVRIPHNF